MSPTLVALLAITALAAPGATQRTIWVVDAAGGPGVHFTDIPPAITAARAGDRIEVHGSGPYSGFILSKGLDIEAVQGATVATLLVQNIPAVEAAWVAGFLVTGASFTAPHVSVQGCRGSVVLSGLAVAPVFTSGIGVMSSDAVVVVDCQVQPSMGITWPAMDLSNSRIMIQRGTFAGSDGVDSMGILGYSTPGTAGLRCTLSSVVAAGVTFRGGRGGNGNQAIPNKCPSAGGNAVEGGAGVLMAGCVLVGGAGGRASPGCSPGGNGLAIAGAFRATSDCSLAGGGGSIIPPLPALLAPGSLVQGSPGTLTGRGQPGALLLLLLDYRTDHVVVPGLDLPLLLSPGFFAGPVLAVGATGQAAYTLTLPPDPYWLHRFLFLQVVAIQPSPLAFGLTNLGTVRMR